MSRHPNADAILALEIARAGVETGFVVSARSVRTTLRHVNGVLDTVSPGRQADAAMTEISAMGRQMVGAIVRAGKATEAGIDAEVRKLRHLLWTSGPPAAAPTGSAARFPAGGYLRDFAEPGEPRLPAGRRYEAAPLVMPEVIGLGIAQQGKTMGDCYFNAAVNAVAHRHPEALRRMVRQDPDDENDVIVSVHGGTYRLPATLPVDDVTGARAGTTSPDGSTLVPYLEKAAAAHFGSWGDLDGGEPVMACWWLAGDLHGYHHAFEVRDMTDDDIQRVVSAPVPAVASVQAHGAPPGWSEAMTRLGLDEQHSYTIEGTTPDGRVQLRNPLPGRDPASPLSIQDLRAANMALAWESGEPYDPVRPTGDVEADGVSRT